MPQYGSGDQAPILPHGIPPGPPAASGPGVTKAAPRTIILGSRVVGRTMMAAAAHIGTLASIGAVSPLVSAMAARVDAQQKAVDAREQLLAEYQALGLGRQQAEICLEHGITLEAVRSAMERVALPAEPIPIPVPRPPAPYLADKPYKGKTEDGFSWRCNSRAALVAGAPKAQPIPAQVIRNQEARIERRRPPKTRRGRRY